MLSSETFLLMATKKTSVLSDRLGSLQRKAVPHGFVLDALTDANPVTRAMFGALAVYVKEKIVFILRDRSADPHANGVWLAAPVEFQESLLADFPNTEPVHIMGKSINGWRLLAVHSCTPGSSYQSWVYAGNMVTFKDEIGNQWSRQSDKLGRPAKVLEPNGTAAAPSLETDYTYDALSNLLSSTQCGAACPATSPVQRSFTYDGLSRLLTATNPESGSVIYGYDANSNLTSKVSPAVNAGSGTQTISYCYDPLNRMTAKFYTAMPSCLSSAGAAATYAYDTSSVSGASNVVGRLTDEKSFVGGNTCLGKKSVRL